MLRDQWRSHPLQHGPNGGPVLGEPFTGYCHGQRRPSPTGAACVQAAREDAFFVFNATRICPMTDLLKTSLNRCTVLQAATVRAVGVSPALRALVHAQCSDAPEKKEVKIGFIPLTDCASVVVASVLGFDKKYGVTIIPTKESSWAG